MTLVGLGVGGARVAVDAAAPPTTTSSLVLVRLRLWLNVLRPRRALALLVPRDVLGELPAVLLRRAARHLLRKLFPPTERGGFRLLAGEVLQVRLALFLEEDELGLADDGDEGRVRRSRRAGRVGQPVPLAYATHMSKLPLPCLL